MHPKPGDLPPDPPPEPSAQTTDRHPDGLPDGLSDGAQAVLAGWVGPAVLFDRDGRVRGLNAAATRLMQADGSWLDGLAQWVVAGRASVESHSSPLPGEEVVEWLPLDLPDGALAALGRTATLERRLRHALTESRQRYKDLVDISSDFAWETDAQGRFVFVSPAGAIGYRADQLVGRPVTDFLLPDFDEGVSPFTTRTPIERVEIWLRDAQGRPACLVSSAVPLIGPGAAWVGARGACRDITDARLRAMELAQVRLREKYLGYIISSTRDDVDPRRTLSIAAGVTLNATGADGAVLRVCRDGAFVPAMDGVDEGVPPALAAPLDDLIGAAAQAEQLLTRTLDAAGRRYDLLAVCTLFRHQVNGAVAVWRLAGDGWGEDERSMVQTIADHVGAALAQASYQERLKTLSERDELTGLYNRRTVMDRLERRLADRPAGTSALLYFDLDNFKSVNDLRGHAAGDTVLRAVGDLLRGLARPGDLAGRLGGDEFMLWIDRVDEAQAQAVAARLLRDGGELLRPLSAGPDKPLGLSVGVALHQGGGGESGQSLVDRGDQGMYAAKRLGKGHHAPAPPYQPSVDGSAA